MSLHPDTIKRGMRCNWKGQPERLIYLRKFNGWHQFQKIGDSRPVWCEVLDADLHMLEETKDDDALQPCGHPKSLVLHSAESGEPLYCETCDDKSGRRDAELRESELAAANAALRKRIAEFENEAREQALQALASEGQWIEQTGAQQKRIAELERDNANLKTVMVAAAEEIHAHWDAHCDAEGYGPQNLMRRLEEGIPSEYGYTAGAFAAQQKRIAELEAQRVPQWISVTERMPEPDSGEVLVWLTGGRCAFDEWHMHREDPTGMSTTHTIEMGLMWRDYEYEDITHWMPLPPPPVERAHGIEEAKR